MDAFTLVIVPNAPPHLRLPWLDADADADADADVADGKRAAKKSIKHVAGRLDVGVIHPSLTRHQHH
jgi:hypothetical protein